MSIFEKFNKSVDLKGLKEDLKEVQENGGGNYEEVPLGKYEVKIDKMEIKETKKGDKLMLSVTFKVLDGPQKNRLIFMNQVITSAYGLHNANEFLRSLKSGIDVIFDDYNQYSELVEDIMDAISDRLEYELTYSENDKEFKVFEITDVLED